MRASPRDSPNMVQAVGGGEAEDGGLHPLLSQEGGDAALHVAPVALQLLAGIELGGLQRSVHRPGLVSQGGGQGIGQAMGDVGADDQGAMT